MSFEDYVVVKIDDSLVIQAYEVLENSIKSAQIAAFLKGMVGPYFKNEIEERFIEEGDSKVGAWEALTEATQSFRESAGFSPSSPINARTGTLFDHMVGGFGSTVPDYPVDVNINGASITIPGEPPDPLTQKKLETAQRGAPPQGVSGPTPPRPVLGEINELDATEIEGLLSLYVGNFFQRNFRG